MKKLLFSVLLIILYSPFLFSQSIGINNSGTAPNASAMLDVQSTTQGMLVPRMDSTQRNMISSPATGLLVFDTSTGGFWFYNGSDWQNLSVHAALADTDGDTQIQVEKNPDEDIIRFDVAGTEKIRLRANANGVPILEPRHLSGSINHANTNFGNEAGLQLNPGIGAEGNTNIGNAASSYTVNGWSNTAIGMSALANNVAGNQNVAIGRSAGLGFTGNSKDGGVFIGYEAGRTENGDNKLYIENSSSSDPLLYGEFDNDILRINGELQIKDEYNFPVIDGFANRVMKTDGNGNLSWATDLVNDADASSTNELVSSFSLSGSTLSLVDAGGTKTVTLSSSDEINDADNNTKIQVEETPNDDQIRFDIDGEEHLVIKENAFGELMVEFSSINSNIFLGRDAGLNTEVTTFPEGRWNTFLGSLTGRSNSIGSYNAHFGASAGSNNQSGDFNTMLGAYAGESFSNTTYNTFIGTFAGQSQVSGSKNTFVGGSSGTLRTGGDENTLIGFRAGRTNTTGSGNIMIGHEAGMGSTSSNRLYIDNSSTVDPLIYGEFDNNLLKANGVFHIDGPLGSEPFKININNAQRLVVESDGQVSIGDNNAFSTRLFVDADTGEDAFRVRVAASTKFKVNSNGSIVNSNSTSTYALQLQNSSTDLLGRGRAFSWNTYSDRRIKSNFKNLDYGLNTILQLQPQSYDHHNSEYHEDGRVVMRGGTTSKDIGLVAQEVYELVPEAVSPPAHEDELWSMDYTRLVPVLIKAMQEQQEQIDEQAKEIAELKTLVEKLLAAER